MKVLALDTEDDSNGAVGIINFFDGRRHTTLTGEECRPQAWNWLTAVSLCEVSGTLPSTTPCRPCGWSDPAGGPS